MSTTISIPPSESRIDPFAEPKLWIANNERITNDADLDAWLALYAPEVIFESIVSGAYDRAEGIDAVRTVATALVEVGRHHGLKIEKRFIAADEGVIVNTWAGGFGGRTGQFGTEIWTLRADGLAIRHEMYTFMDVRPSDGLLAGIRALLGGESRVMADLGRMRRRRRKGSLQ